MDRLDTHFNTVEMRSLIGGESSLDIDELNVSSKTKAKKFLYGYGFDIDDAEQLEKLWSYYSRALVYIQSELITDEEEIPEALSSREKLDGIENLIIMASAHNKNSVWACALLKVIHILIHLDNDLFTVFFSEIQEQILKPIKDMIYKGPVVGTSLSSESGEKIRLHKFHVKSFKRPESSVTKLLTKPNAVAFTILDKLGVRLVTKSVFDVFRVLRFLHKNQLISLPHNVPNQANNTLYPLELFLEVMNDEAFLKNKSDEEIESYLLEQLKERGSEYNLNKKNNNKFSSVEYKFIKFITRKLIRVEVEKDGVKNKLSFFYPFEIQVIDYDTYLSNMTGQASHDAYKRRKRDQARLKILGLPPVFSRQTKQGH